jgi:hypothetical protein
MNTYRSQAAICAIPQAPAQIVTQTAAQVAAIVLCALLLTAAYAQEAISPAYARAARKIAWLQENGRSPNPSHNPTILTAEEWNAYLNQGGVKLPDGVSNVRIASRPATAQGDADVDFDRLTGNRTRNNPFLALFTGKHHVTVIAHASAANGVGTVQVESVTFDGVVVPRLALEYFSDRYLRPKYGNAVGLDSTFHLRSRIDSAVLGSNQVTITQR